MARLTDLFQRGGSYYLRIVLADDHLFRPALFTLAAAPESSSSAPAWQDSKMENPYSPPRSAVDDIAPVAEKKDRPVIGFLVGLLAMLVSESLTMIAQGFVVGVVAFVRGDSPIAQIRETRLDIEAGGGLLFLMIAAAVSSLVGGLVCAQFARKRTQRALVALLSTTVLLGGISEHFNWRVLAFIPVWGIGFLVGSRLERRKKP